MEVALVARFEDNIEVGLMKVTRHDKHVEGKIAGHAGVGART